MFCIEIIANNYRYYFYKKYSLCPRIIVIPVIVFQDKENVLYRNNSNPYSDIISIQNILFVLE